MHGKIKLTLHYDSLAVQLLKPKKEQGRENSSENESRRLPVISLTKQLFKYISHRTIYEE